MLIEHKIEVSNLKLNSKVKVLFSCDECETQFQRAYCNYIKMLGSQHYDKDYCIRCWRRVLNNREEYKKKLKHRMSQVCSDPGWRDRNSKSKKGKINLGDNNGMKSAEARKKASISRKKMLLDPKRRKEISDYTRRAWLNGKFDHVRVGKCKWFEHLKPNGEICKLQGTWELAFAKWMDANGTTYKSHVGKLRYIEEGIERYYYPDFRLGENHFIEIKSDYFLSLQPEKINLVRLYNPDVKIELLTKNLLLEMGVEL